MKYKNLQDNLLVDIKKIIKKHFGQCPNDLKLIFPPNVKFGDFALECFTLAGRLHKSPNEIAKELALLIKPTEIIQKVQSIGPYVNIKVFNEVLFKDSCTTIFSRSGIFSKFNIRKKQNIMVEYLSPNTNKPLHLGHIRNGALGMAISNLYKEANYRVTRTSLINDRGVHICKSMLAWQLWGNKATPELEHIKGDHFIGSLYIRYAREFKKNPDIEKDVLKMLKKWEAGDSEIIKLWKLMNSWVYSGFNETYEKLKLKFDVFYFESNTYKLGKETIRKGFKNGIFTKDEKDNIIFCLSEKEFGLDKDGNLKKIVLLRPNGTSLYMTQDIGTVLLRVKKYSLDSLIYVVGSEQEYHFKTLFKILGKIDSNLPKKLYHLSYGMVYLPDGKMKSREGKIVDADDLIKQMEDFAANEIRIRSKGKELSSNEIERRSVIIGIGAIKFYLLRVRPSQDIHFDPNESISFDGFTGPYCQYAYARIFGILDNVKGGINVKSCDFSTLGNEEELLLIRKLIQFPEKIKIATDELNPSHIAIHIFDIAKAFNQFYNKHKVLQAETQELAKARLILIKSTAIVLKRGLNLLGIDVLEEM